MNVPEDFVVIGEMIGDGEMVCFSKETGAFVRFFDGYYDEEYKNFAGILNSIQEILGDKPIISMNTIDRLLAELEEEENNK